MSLLTFYRWKCKPINAQLPLDVQLPINAQLSLNGQLPRDPPAPTLSAGGRPGGNGGSLPGPASHQAPDPGFVAFRIAPGLIS